MYTNVQVIERIKDAVELVENEFGFNWDTPEGDAIGLVVAALASRLEKPTADMSYVAYERYGIPLSEVHAWWHWS